jgi:hypothetical protein
MIDFILVINLVVAVASGIFILLPGTRSLSPTKKDSKADGSMLISG